MWRVIGLAAGVFCVGISAIGEVRLSSSRPLARPERSQDGRIVVRPLPRPDVATPHPDIFRPTQRPERPAVEVFEMTASMRPPLRPATLVIKAALPVPLRTDPPSRPAPAPLPVGRADVVMIGDSITAGGHWAAHYPGIRIVNRGVSGDTAQKILARMDGILATQPSRALLMFGINDIYNGVPVTRIMQRYERIVGMLMARDIEVVVQSTLECSGSVCGDKLGRVHALNARLRALAASRGLRFVDINGALSDQGGLKEAYSRDGVHLNGAGYAKWYVVVGPYVGRV